MGSKGHTAGLAAPCVSVAVSQRATFICTLSLKRQLSNEWQLSPGTEKGCWPLATGPATLLGWELLTGLWGNSSYMWTIFYVHQRENKGLSDYKCTVTAKWAKAAKALSCPLSFSCCLAPSQTSSFPLLKSLKASSCLYCFASCCLQFTALISTSQAVNMWLRHFWRQSRFWL